MGKFTLKNEQILRIYQTLANINGAKNTNFNYAKAVNKASLKRKAQPLSETEAAIYSHITKFNEAYLELLKKYANKDENSSPIVKERKGNIVIYDISPENSAKVDKEVQELRTKKFKKDFIAFDKAAKDFEKILNKQQEVDLVTFKKKDLPPDLDDSIEVLLPIIE